MYRVDVKVEPHRLKVLTYFWSGQTLAHLSVQIFGHVGFPGSWSKRKAGPRKVLSVSFKKFVRMCYVKQLIKKFLKIFFALILKFGILKNNGPVVLFKYIFRHWNCLLSPVETDDKDRSRLKLEKIGRQLFQVTILCLQNSPKGLHLLMVNVP